ncbi:hypothetical protein Poli38472_000146 [Pythium oligandrum]|uniref:glucan endo-1,3-beta-D-glucosidase n=1 Tax=Pythium oligandrum TaxID=41045 RepID=A0A8K1FGK5_PYTOL|nr:hypothetical protein Poli38472_000146 [Pythium oligandrum]|eukprot:TMW60104.1 hypothetical protein Poli38472_000146 [Pythium oligandrum]
MTIGKLESILTSGMATMTFKYTALTPRIITSSNLVTVNGQRVNASAQISNNRFLLALGNGQNWVLYTSGNITLRGSNSTTGLLANASFTGYIRAAIYTSDAHLAVLDKTKACFLDGVEVKSINTNSYAFNFKTSGVCTSGLFHYLHIHHLDTLDQSTASVVTGTDLISSTRGKMTGVLTKKTPPMVQFTDKASVPADFYSPRKPNATIVAANHITQTLINDINASWSIPVYGSYYFNGKAAQKYAQLCLLARDSSVAGVNGTALLRKCLDKLEAILLPYVENKWSYPMKFDTVYRGIVSSLGFAYNDPYADFGNTMYNDHHYYWGYWIMTAAIVNYLDPMWSRLAQMNRLTSFLIRDVANPTSNDKGFAKFRYFDWFRGHSFSHGVTPFWDGKDQESTSEEINFHYGMTLFGKVTKNAELTAIGQLMLKLNTRSIQTYFLMQNNNRAHPAEVIPNKVTGIFFDNKIDYTTWFTAEKYAIHGIQMIPITPVTEFVRTRAFVQEEWSQVLSKLSIVVKSDMTNGWLSLLYANYATVNSTAALQQLQKVALDDGLSRSWALYIAATRP